MHIVTSYILQLYVGNKDHGYIVFDWKQEILLIGYNLIWCPLLNFCKIDAYLLAGIFLLYGMISFSINNKYIPNKN